MKLKGLKQFKAEMSGIVRNKAVLISVIGVIAIPVLYSWMFLAAFWDPYSQLDRLPVAIVNEDAGYDYNGETLHIGLDFEDKLKENEMFEWHFVSRTEAEEGLSDQAFYMAIEIPSDFSEKAATLTTETPTPAQLSYFVNESYNFLAAQIGETAVDKMKAELNKEVTSAYTKTIFDQMEQLVDGIGQASDGAGEIADGTVKAKDGAELIQQNLAKLVSGSLTLQEGVDKLSAGGQELAGGSAELKNGAASLSSGLSQLSAAQKQLGEGAVSLGEGAGFLGAGAVKLSGGMEQLAEASKELAAGALSGQQASEQLAGGLNQSAAGAEQLASGASQLAGGLAQLAQADPELAQMDSFKALLTASKELAAGLETSAAAQTQLREGAVQLNAGLAKMTDGLSAFDAKLQEASAGSKQLGAGGEQLTAGATSFLDGMEQFGAKLTEASEGGAQLAAGADHVYDGSAQLASGLTQLSSSIAPFVSGSVELEDGAQQVASGLLKLEAGTQELSGKLGDAADQTSDLQLTDKMVDMFAQPIELGVEKVTKVENYGTGFTPYFLSLGLYVGAMLLTIVYSVREPAIRPANGWSWFWSKALTLGLIGVIQALLADAAMIFLLDLEVQSMGQFIGFSILTSLAFMMIIQFLVTLLGNPGRFLAIVILIFQLTTSAGTFPIELIPNWMQKVSPFLPMTYSVAGLKDTISNHAYSNVGYNSIMLACFAILFALLTLAYFTWTHRKEKEESSSSLESPVLS